MGVQSCCGVGADGYGGRSFSAGGASECTGNSYHDESELQLRASGEIWKQNLIESMAEAGREKKRIAEEMGSYNEGVPAITVI